METKTLHFSVQGEFITQLAREQCHYEGRFNYAMELLEGSLQTDQLTQNEIREKAFSILDGKAVIEGIYPEGDYGFKYLEEQDKFWKLGDMIEKTMCKKRELEEELEKVKCKLFFIQDQLGNGEKRTLNRQYKEEFSERLFAYDPEVDEERTGSSLLDSFLKRMSSESEDDYGWLEPNGTFHAVEWGEHQQWATEWLRENMTEEEYEEYEDKNPLRVGCDGDYLTERGWILLHNPAQGIGQITIDPAKEPTKAQKEFLYDYYMERKCEREANEIWKEGE